jgi:DNA-binding NarL/FixJ family response regulator
MAKQCSSKGRAIPKTETAVELTKPPARLWEERLFKNTYVRHGKSREVKGWAVRFQFQGVRKTFSLQHDDRRLAGAEARDIHEALKAEGWEAARQVHRSRTAPHALALQVEDGLAKANVDYWKPRLIRRKYTEPLQAGSGRFLSVRIGDESTQHWFPLGTEDEGAAAAKALEIHRTLQEEGWGKACGSFPREITVAIFWAVSPVAVTYSTIYTHVGNRPGVPAGIAAQRKGRHRTVAIIESDRGIQRALAYWLERQGVRCLVASGEDDDVRETLRARPPQLLLFNRALAGSVDLMQDLRRRLPQLSVFAYDIAEHIDQIFSSLTGVKAGYIFRRRVPSELLEPVRGVLRQLSFSSEEVAQHIKEYFGNLFSPGLPVGGNPRLANLTSRELEVLNLLSKGSVDKEIAEVLRISVWTVHSHLKKIYDKLQVHTRTEAVLKYLEK